ncbi:MAG: tRNA glutamyl-Q(34) synthetase GluQRS [Gammaproteobacteria bacterium]|nr:tRNA glutamyl-Q(34) synthetase GluQRS [Gammaproteobacteria bacterium]
MTNHTLYRGRFAPSPTGPLHFGSLIAATGSYLEAKANQGQWLLRIDDIDPPREQQGATAAILRTLEAFGFEWDEEVLFQSKRFKRYQAAVDDLIQKQLAYPCSCSRSSIMEQTGQDKGNIVYPGFCRNGVINPSNETSIRLRCDNQTISFNDAIQGPQSFTLAQTHGDFILQRRDHYFSYHLASGIDDAEQGITQVVRGSDLLACTPCQIYIQHLFNLPSPGYSHLPIVVNATGHKLSKQTYAEPINASEASYLLHNALKFLGQMPSISLKTASITEIWSWAESNWNQDLVPRKLQQFTSGTYDSADSD